MTESMEVRALAIVPRTIDECTDLAERLAKSSLLPKAMQGKMPDVLVTILAGQELGLSPMTSLRSLHVIEGKPVLSAHGKVALVLGSGKAVYFDRIEESETSVTYETLRVGSKTPRRCTWTMAMAKNAGLHLKDNWRAFPRQMLAARAMSELAEDVYPDVLSGTYTLEDIERPNATTLNAPTGNTPAQREPEAVDAEVVSETPAIDWRSKIDNAESVDALKAAGQEIAALKLTGQEKIESNERYSAKMKALKAPVQAVAP